MNRNIPISCFSIVFPPGVKKTQQEEYKDASPSSYKIKSKAHTSNAQ